MSKSYGELKSLKDAMWENFYKEEDKWEKTKEAEFLEAKGGQPRHWFQLGFDAGLQAVVNAEPADVVPVVRCKDCKYHTAYRCPNDNLHWTHNCTLGNGTYGDDYYCADGERRVE